MYSRTRYALGCAALVAVFQQTAIAQCVSTDDATRSDCFVLFAGQTIIKGSLCVEFYLDSGFSLEETHVYVGGERLPRRNGVFTVAPGQYPYIHENLFGAAMDSYEVSGATGDIYIVAHAVVCGVFGE